MTRRTGKKRQAPANATASKIMSGYSPEVQLIANRLRKLIKATVPSATEVAVAGWHGFGYRHPLHGYVCGLFLHEDRVKLGFEHGEYLYDPDYLFENSGTKIKYISLADRKQIREKPLKKLLTAAMHIQGKGSKAA